MIVIDIKSQFGAFSKPFSNVGGLLTYKIPPKTAITGMLGAILGYSFPQTKATLKGIRVGIQPLRRIRTEQITYTSHYGTRKGRTLNVKQEILIKPWYRIYIDMEDVEARENMNKGIRLLLKRNEITGDQNNLTENLRLLLKKNISFYNLYMGRNAFPLEYNLRDIDLKTPQLPRTGKWTPTKAAIPKESISDYKISTKGEEWYEMPRSFRVSMVNNLPVSYLPDKQGEPPKRQIGEFKDLILPPPGETIEVRPKRHPEHSYHMDKEGNLIACF